MTAVSTLSEQDLRRMLDVVSPDAAASDGPELPEQVLRGLAELIPCSAVSFHVMDPPRRQVLCGQELDLRPFPAVDEAEADALFWEAYADCLACSQPELLRGPGVASQWLDYYTEREYRRLRMADYTALWGIWHELVICLPSYHGLTRRLMLVRDAGDPPFSERDRLLLTLLRPHLSEVRDRVEAERRTLPALTPRQVELLRRLARGDTNRQLARDLGLSEATVRKHLENIYTRLHVHSRTEALAHTADLLTG
jgi:DNA-binding CsgD family transcriptional regulator